MALFGAIYLFGKCTVPTNNMCSIHITNIYFAAQLNRKLWAYRNL